MSASFALNGAADTAATAQAAPADDAVDTRVLIMLDDAAPQPGAVASDRPLADRLRFADITEPQVSVLDLGVTRGDGIFETLDAVDGYAQALEPHLARLVNSARLLDLPHPDLDLFREAITQAIAASTSPRLSVKLVLTRGVEGGTVSTGWVFAEPVPDFDEARRNGISVVTLDRGYRHDAPQTSPWLLQGAKTLSYAVNKAVYREAARRGADDVIFISSDGFVLEGPTSNVVLQFGTHLVTPSTDQGILRGTAQGAFFEYAEANGLTTEYRQVTPDELAAADSVWLSSSVRQIVPVREIDGVARTFDEKLNSSALEYLLARHR
jgi:4-amino-4-deoxychorismate lyase